MIPTYEKSYTGMQKLETFEERFRYLKLKGAVGESTFGFNRYLNQAFYTSKEWKQARNTVIARDEGCDLGVPGREIAGKVYIHHINPLTEHDILARDYKLFDPENLVCVSKRTHDAIHYGDESLLILDPVERKPNDTCPWRK